MKGIYKIENVANGKVYIGQSIDINERKDAHFEALRSNRHPNMYLQRSFNKYGERDFRFELIEETEDLDVREVNWIDFYQSCDPNKGYNLLSGGKNFTMTDNVKLKISESLKSFYEDETNKKKLSERVQGENNGFYGRKHSVETVRKILESRKWYKHSEETKKKMSEQKKGENHHFYSKTFSDEYRKKLSEAHKGQEPKNKIQFSADEVTAITEMFSKGKSLKEIAIVFRCSNIPIKRVLQEQGVYKQKSPRKPLTQEQLSEAKQMLEEGMTLKKVSEHFGLTSQGLKKKLLKGDNLYDEN